MASNVASRPLQGADLVAAVDETALIRETRERARALVPTPDRMSSLATGGGLIATVAAWLALAPPPSATPWGVFVACILVHAAASCLEFEIGPGSAVPTTPVLVVALFLLPPQLVPLVALCGLVIAGYATRLWDRSRHDRFSVLAGSAWHSVGPALVFALAGVRGPSLDDLPIYVIALAMQFAFDAASSWIRDCWGLGLPPSRLAGALRFTFMADLLLAPVGLAAALAVPGSLAALAFLAAPILMLAMLQRDRKQQISRAVMLSEAFMQTADSARRDALTGLRNRLAWEEAIGLYGDALYPTGVVLADVDGLKKANDVYGHEAGDRVLIAIAQLIASATPPDGRSVAARLGGDEFGILLPGVLATEAKQIAHSLKVAIEMTPRSEGGPEVSASVGFGIAPTGAALSAAFLEADRRLYREKARRQANRS